MVRTDDHPWNPQTRTTTETVLREAMQALVRVQAHMLARIVVEIRAADKQTSLSSWNRHSVALYQVLVWQYHGIDTLEYLIHVYHGTHSSTRVPVVRTRVQI